MKTLHLYSQYANHTEAYIVGDKEALTELRDMLNKLLQEDDQAQVIETYAADGEGYILIGIKTEDMEGAKLPYSDPDYNCKGSAPHRLLSKEQYRKLMQKIKK